MCDQNLTGLNYRDSLNSEDSFIDFLISETGDLWEDYIEHPFVVLLGKGTLPTEAFIHFMRQGYIYLLHYARLYAMAAYKAKSFEEIAASAVIIQSCIDEVKVNQRVSPAPANRQSCYEFEKWLNDTFHRYVKPTESQKKS